MFVPMSYCVIPMTAKRRAHLRVGLVKEDFMKTVGHELNLKEVGQQGGESDPPHTRKTVRYFIICHFL